MCVASLPRDQRCWHASKPFKVASKRSRIASERPTLLAPRHVCHTSRASHVASLPRDQRCWHTYENGVLVQAATSHRFRETNAVGTKVSCRVRRDMSRSHRFRETNAVGTPRCPHGRRFRRVASLPRDQRCWHSMPRVNEVIIHWVASLPRDQRCWHFERRRTWSPVTYCRIASERPTLLALGHEIGLVFQHFVASLPRDQRCWHSALPSICRSRFTASHRFRETNAVGTVLFGKVRRGAGVASLPRDQHCWHLRPSASQTSFASRIASERPTLLAHGIKVDITIEDSRIASERPTLLAPHADDAYAAPALGRIASERPTLLALRHPGSSQNRGTGRIASERPTLLALRHPGPSQNRGTGCIASERPTLLAQQRDQRPDKRRRRSHRFRKVNAVEPSEHRFSPALD